MKKAAGLDSNNSGLIFYGHGELLQRGNAGWCGTPPITYKNYEGKWKAVRDSVINIKVEYWDGQMEYNMFIVMLVDSIFKYRIDIIASPQNK